MLEIFGETIIQPERCAGRTLSPILTDSTPEPDGAFGPFAQPETRQYHRQARVMVPWYSITEGILITKRFIVAGTRLSVVNSPPFGDWVADLFQRLEVLRRLTNAPVVPGVRLDLLENAPPGLRGHITQTNVIRIVKKTCGFGVPRITRPKSLNEFGVGEH